MNNANLLMWTVINGIDSPLLNQALAAERSKLGIIDTIVQRHYIQMRINIMDELHKHMLVDQFDPQTLQDYLTSEIIRQAQE